MNTQTTAAWVYEGLWGVLASVFRVPRDPPTLPVHPGEEARSLRPSPRYLRYLKFQFWIGLTLIDVVIVAVWLVILVAAPIAGLILALPALAVAVLPDLIAYAAIHLRYDTTWYVLTPRSIRIRRGIWAITETTITFENIQNITVQQGPLQRYYGIASLHIRTAGGGGGHGKHSGSDTSHLGVIEGVENAPEIRDLIAARVRASRSAGLGDEHHADAGAPAWSPEALAALRQLAEEARRLRLALA